MWFFYFLGGESEIKGLNWIFLAFENKFAFENNILCENKTGLFHDIAFFQHQIILRMKEVKY